MLHYDVKFEMEFEREEILLIENVKKRIILSRKDSNYDSRLLEAIVWHSKRTVYICDTVLLNNNNAKLKNWNLYLLLSLSKVAQSPTIVGYAPSFQIYSDLKITSPFQKSKSLKFLRSNFGLNKFGTWVFHPSTQIFAIQEMLKVFW